MKTWATPNGKEIALFIDPKTAHIRIKFIPGGELPEKLAGQYTRESEAEKDILIYLSTKTKSKQ